MDIIKSILYRLQMQMRNLRNYHQRNKLLRTDFTLISNHCMGGIMYHDLGLQFLSPTINLKILPDDYIEFIEHLDYYLKQRVEHAPEMEGTFPVGKIGRKDGNGYIYIYFVHYHSFYDAVEKWKSRSKRINWENIIILMTARDGCEYETLQRFERLPYERRICFTLKPYPEFPHCKYARLDNGKELRGYISDMVSITGKRAYECNGFDYVEFINGRDQLPYK